MLDVPKAVRIASPTAMPTIRATVTAALAMPNAARPAASTAAVERGVTVSPKPSPKSARLDGHAARARVSAVSLASRTSPTMPAASPTIVTAGRADAAHHEAGDGGTERHREGQRTQHDALLVGTGEEDAVHERGHADDDGRERVARQQAHEDGRAEDPVREEPQVEERHRRAPHPDEREDAADDRDDDRRDRDRQRVAGLRRR